MIMVIGVSTTVEYGLRSAYETLVGRLTELTARSGSTDEDRSARGWRRTTSTSSACGPGTSTTSRPAAGLWRDTPCSGPDLLRKWERKYALTTEYAIKARLWLADQEGDQASYDEALPVTAVVVDRLPAASTELPTSRCCRRLPDGAALVTVPRYEAFTRYASRARAARGELPRDRGQPRRRSW